MEVYDPEAEKEAFANVNLGAMRSAAKKWLLSTALKLGLYLGQVEGDVLGVDVFIQWECFDDALDLIENARMLATGQGDHARLTRLYEQEIEIARRLYIGDERIEEMTRLVLMAIESSKKHSIAAEVRNLTTFHIEINKYRFNSTGTFDLKSATSYFKSAFFKQRIDEWPITVQIDKLHLDEWNFYIQGKLKESVAVSIKILELYNANPSIRLTRKEDHAKILFRMSGNNAEIGNRRQGMIVLTAFRAVDPMSLENRDCYLAFFLQALFWMGYTIGEMSLAQESATIWEEQKEYILSQPIDSTAINSMLCVCSYRLAVGDIANARMVLNLLLKVEDHIQPVWAQEIFKLFHIITLIEEGDDVGLISFARRYKRQLKRLDKTSLGLKLLCLLQKPKHIHKPKSLLRLLPQVQILLEMHQISDDTTYRPFLYPLIQWSVRKQDTLK
jgi:hypothetical protein